jgi:hypothetical protein
MLALAVGAAMQQHCPDEALVGPTTFRVDTAFITEIFQLGVLQFAVFYILLIYFKVFAEPCQWIYHSIIRL